MKAVFRQYGFFIFITFAALHLMAVHFNLSALRFVTKPLLMPVLAMVVYSHGQKTKWMYILAALIFSFLGDSLLLLEDKNPLFFIVGLASFLITHILYILFFLGIKQHTASLFKRHPYIPILVVAYGMALVYLLYPSLGALKIPVLLYATIICLMLICSFYVYKNVLPPAGIQFVTGAVFFVISDSLLAVNKFHRPFSFAGLLIMLTYCAAQYFIVRGFINHEAQLKERQAPNLLRKTG